MEKQIKNFTAKLISVAPEAKPTATGTLARRCTVEFTEPATGNVTQASARIYENNYKYGMEVGKSYSAKAEPYIAKDGNVLVDITVSHLTNAGSATLAAFGFSAPVPADLNAVG